MELLVCGKFFMEKPSQTHQTEDQRAFPEESVELS
jgi:hypothetical protein